MDTADTSSPLPPLRVTAIVRVSTRVRGMKLVARPGKGLELVVPPRATRPEMDAFLAKNAAWAARILKKQGSPMDAREAVMPVLPREMNLRAVGETWRIDYRRGRAEEGYIRLRFREAEGVRVIEVGHGSGEADASTVIGLLQTYLKDRGRVVLPPWVARLVRETGLPAPARLRIGLQKSVWGSRSASGTLSLSARLLLLPPELVHHVILHELCHAGNMHHRASFHRSLEKHDPSAAIHRRNLREESQRMPDWSST